MTILLRQKKLNGNSSMEDREKTIKRKERKKENPREIQRTASNGRNNGKRKRWKSSNPIEKILICERRRKKEDNGGKTSSMEKMK